MLKRIRGFTLIELLIVVAILGILAALLIPNAITAIQKAKQKATMKSIVTISTAIADYITDNGIAPANNGIYTGAADFYTAICPFYIKVLPITDQWGTSFNVWCGATAAKYGILAPNLDDFLISSFGRDKAEEAFSFNPLNPEAGMYVVSKGEHFNYDIIMWNGNWIHAPKTAQSTTSAP